VSATAKAGVPAGAPAAAEANELTIDQLEGCVGGLGDGPFPQSPVQGVDTSEAKAAAS
jgi:hypothetical protein